MFAQGQQKSLKMCKFDQVLHCTSVSILQTMPQTSKYQISSIVDKIDKND